MEWGGQLVWGGAVIAKYPLRISTGGVDKWIT